MISDYKERFLNLKSSQKAGICILIFVLLIAASCSLYGSSKLPSLYSIAASFSDEDVNLPWYTLSDSDGTYDHFSSVNFHHVTLSEKKMVKNSDLIIRGEVKEILPAKRDPISNYIYHELIIEVEKQYKGSLKSDTVVVRQLGGIVDNSAFIYHSTFYYRPGDEVVMYLYEH